MRNLKTSKKKTGTWTFNPPTTKQLIVEYFNTMVEAYNTVLHKKYNKAAKDTLWKKNADKITIDFAEKISTNAWATLTANWIKNPKIEYVKYTYKDGKITKDKKKSAKKKNKTAK